MMERYHIKGVLNTSVHRTWWNVITLRVFWTHLFTGHDGTLSHWGCSEHIYSQDMMERYHIKGVLNTSVHRTWWNVITLRVFWTHLCTGHDGKRYHIKGVLNTSVHRTWWRALSHWGCSEHICSQDMMESVITLRVFWTHLFTGHDCERYHIKGVLNTSVHRTWWRALSHWGCSEHICSQDMMERYHIKGVLNTSIHRTWWTALSHWGCSEHICSQDMMESVITLRVFWTHLFTGHDGRMFWVIVLYKWTDTYLQYYWFTCTSAAAWWKFCRMSGYTCHYVCMSVCPVAHKLAVCQCRCCVMCDIFDALNCF